jgi:hypothetical protein
MKKIFLMILLSQLTLASSKMLFASLHGKMSVTHSVLNSGNHILEVKELVGRKKKKAIFENRQTIDLKMSMKEDISSVVGVMCMLNKNLVYAVFSKAQAKEKGSFPALRAWSIEEKKIKLEPIKDIKKVTCSWNPEGESQFPY